MDKMIPLHPLQVSRQIAAPYHNQWLTFVNDHEVRLSVMTQQFPWHRHPDSDETFIGVDGEMIIEFESGSVRIGPGEMLTVPAGTLHRTRPSGQRSVNLIFERCGAETIFG